MDRRITSILNVPVENLKKEEHLRKQDIDGKMKKTQNRPKYV
jgi:hypothetical protein